MAENLPDDWESQITADCFDLIPTTNNKIKTKNASVVGRFPIIDQGQDFISGYTDDEEKVINIHAPVIVYGDHTRAIKWVYFDFVPGADGTKVLKAHDYLSARYAFYQLKALDIPDKGYSRHFKFLKELRFSIPPLAEQKVIAEKLDTLLAQVETTKARLERIPEIIKRFRQSVLAAAVSGKLTEEWRELNGITIDWQKGVFSDFAEIKHGFAFPSSCFTEAGKAVVLTPGNFLEDGTLDFSNKRVVRASEFDKKWVLAVDDLVIVMTDLSQKKLILGVAALIDDKNIYLHNQRIGLVEPANKNLNKRFLQCVINSQEFKKIVDDTSSGTLIQHTSPKKIGAVPVAIPSTDEQTEIVRRVEQLFAFADTIEQKTNIALERVNNLTQSILAKAFRGELTADWRAANPELISGENSAEALLERIKAERAGNVGRKRR